jgi:NADPH-dependent ferric siderophore reductase
MEISPAASRSTQRVRHELIRRTLQVLRTQRVTPKLVRVTLYGEQLKGFVSSAADDHIKVFFPGGGDEVAARDYTPRRYDAQAGELDIEFVLHGDGPAAQWAAQVQPGQSLTIAGPRGSFVVSGRFDWYWLIGDETALPAISRRLGELPVDSKVFVVVEVADASEELRFDAPTTSVSWLHRDGKAAGDHALLLGAVAALATPAGVGYTWMACESGVARSLRNYLLNERGFDKQWVKAAGYWKHGARATHEPIDD